jgi:DNA-directed RNA polymerase specialized sigma24 family protein
MLELRLQGYNLDEIGADTRRSVRTVSRLLERIKQRLRGDMDPGS